MRQVGILAKLFTCLIFLLGFSSLCFGEELTVTLLDVGQADAILIQSAGKRVLVDAGEKKTQAGDILREKGIDSFDLVIATHPHADHIGGMLDIVENFGVKVYMDNGFPHTSAGYSNLMEAVEQKVLGGSSRYVKARAGQRLNLGKEAYFEVLWPDDAGLKETRSDINANSIILKLTHGDVCFALMGDAEAETEAKVADKIGKCQILKVSHHGSRYSSTPTLLTALQPKIALISCGLANKHGHPGQETLAAFSQLGTQVYRTDLMGEITAKSDGHQVTIVTDHAPLQITKININTASKEALMELPGTGEKTADAIIAYREANGPYAKIEDVFKASPSQQRRLEKIIPFITVTGGSSTGLTSGATVSSSVATTLPVNAAGKVDINTAGVQALAVMPGMSAGKAQAAIAYREANGAFASCQELVNVKGIGQKTVDKLLDVCTTSSGGAQSAPTPAAAPTPVAAPTPAAQSGRININVADEATLAAMPGMSAKKAQAAVQYRNANGPFKSCENLSDVKGIGEKTVKKLLDVCTVE